MEKKRCAGQYLWTFVICALHKQTVIMNTVYKCVIWWWFDILLANKGIKSCHSPLTKIPLSDIIPTVYYVIAWPILNYVVILWSNSVNANFRFVLQKRYLHIKNPISLNFGNETVFSHLNRVVYLVCLFFQTNQCLRPLAGPIDIVDAVYK